MSDVHDARDVPRPIHWPSLTVEECAEEWESLRDWVARLWDRYPHLTRLPECWWRHSDLVEVLAALRDCERACHHPSAPATGPVEWQRALRDMESRIEIWIKRFTCNVPGRGHDEAPGERRATEGHVPDGWAEFVAADVEKRRAARGRSALP